MVRGTDKMVIQMYLLKFHRRLIYLKLTKLMVKINKFSIIFILQFKKLMKIAKTKNRSLNSTLANGTWVNLME